MGDSASSSRKHAPRRVLHRAANLVTSNGKPIHDELYFGEATQLPSRQSKLTNSIKRKFTQVKRVSLSLTRSKSTPAPHTIQEKQGHGYHEEEQKRKGHTKHGRSFSVRDVRPILSPNRSSSSSNTNATTAYYNNNDHHLAHRRFSLPEISRPNYPSLPSYDMTDVAVPDLLQRGTPMTKVSSKRQKKFEFKLDPDQGQIVYESNRLKIIPIESIKEMRFGSEARYYREQFELSKEYEDVWITIIYILDGSYKTLHLVAPNPDVFRMWHTTLRQLHAIRQELMTGLGNLEMRQAIWEKHYWKGADVQSDQKLSFEEVEMLCRRLNINTSPDELQHLFKQADEYKRGYLDFSDFRSFVKLLKSRPELNRLYKKIASPNGELTVENFTKFMKDSQLSSLDAAELQELFNRYAAGESHCKSPTTVTGGSARQDDPGAAAHEAPEGTAPAPPPAPPAPNSMSLEGFTSFLLSGDNAVIHDTGRGVTHDMTRPLSEYYISSSHNTYLVGHQLVGVSTIEGYIRALLSSCRSVELDIYDGDHEPMIFHGKTLTSKVSVREVCEAIKKYGFISSPYPIIISAEIHCGISQQELLAAIMKEVFADRLINVPSEEERPTIQELPSPEQLKGKILLKAKNLLLTPPVSAEPETIVSDSSTSSSSSSDGDLMSDINSGLEKAGSMLSRIGRKRRPSDADKAVGNGVVRSPSKRSPPEGKSKPKMSLALVGLLVYTVGVKCRGINKKEEYAPEHMFSLSENSINKQMKAGMTDLIKHTKSHLVRVYPKGTRLGSSNYEPHRFWSAGAQLVALNWQTFDLGYMINHAMFQRNGRAGYVLKPYPLREARKEQLMLQRQCHLDLTIISAQQLPRAKDENGIEIIGKRIADPFVEVTLHVPDWMNPLKTSPIGTPNNDIPSSTPAQMQKYRTSVVKNNGFNPVWEEKLRIPYTCVEGMEDLVFIRFAVLQEDADNESPLAYYCASLGSLLNGYRHLPLHDAQLSQYLFSTLFVRIQGGDSSTP